MAITDEATPDGYDVQMQTNHLSHFLLTAELWPLLETAQKKRGDARVVQHSSGARKQGGKKLDARYLGKNGGDLGGNSAGIFPFSGARWTRYQQTKLANVAFTYALRDRLAKAGSQIKALVAHPGLAATRLQVTTVADGGMSDWFTGYFMNGLSQSGEDGTVPLLICTCASEWDGRKVSSGDFYGPALAAGRPILVPEEPLADEAARELLWRLSTEATGAKFPF